MSQENVTTLNEVFASFERDGIPDLELFDPNVELINFDSFPVSRRYHGREGMGQWLRDALEPFENVRFELVEVLAHDADQVVTTLRARGDSRYEGPPELVWGAVWTFSGGRIIRTQGFRTPEKALEAAGLLESE